MKKTDKMTVKFKTTIEDLFEKHNSKLQIGLFVISLLIGAYYNISLKNELGIVIGLLVLISGELVSLSIKDCITQRKLNGMGTKLETLRGALVRVHDFDLTDFFENTKGEFFISGIALNGFFERNRSTIEKFLKEGKEVDVLIVSIDAIKENARLYYGIKNESRNVKDILDKQVLTLDHIRRIPDIFTYMKNGQFRLKTLNVVFSTSFVAYDIFEDNIFAGKRRGKELKASFYQYRCIEPKDEPNIVVDSFFSRDWYVFFKNIIETQWKDGEAIRSEKEFEELYQKLKGNIDGKEKDS